MDQLGPGFTCSAALRSTACRMQTRFRAAGGVGGQGQSPFQLGGLGQFTSLSVSPACRLEVRGKVRAEDSAQGSQNPAGPWVIPTKPVPVLLWSTDMPPEQYP